VTVRFVDRVRPKYLAGLTATLCASTAPAR
jgi:hypothetical protein